MISKHLVAPIEDAESKNGPEARIDQLQKKVEVGFGQLVAACDAKDREIVRLNEELRKFHTSTKPAFIVEAKN